MRDFIMVQEEDGSIVPYYPRRYEPKPKKIPEKSTAKSPKAKKSTPRKPKSKKSTPNVLLPLAENVIKMRECRVVLRNLSKHEIETMTMTKKIETTKSTGQIVANDEIDVLAELFSRKLILVENGEMEAQNGLENHSFPIGASMSVANHQHFLNFQSVGESTKIEIINSKGVSLTFLISYDTMLMVDRLFGLLLNNPLIDTKPTSTESVEIVNIEDVANENSALVANIPLTEDMTEVISYFNAKGEKITLLFSRERMSTMMQLFGAFNISADTKLTSPEFIGVEDINDVDTQSTLAEDFGLQSKFQSTDYDADSSDDEVHKRLHFLLLLIALLHIMLFFFCLGKRH